MSEAKVSGRDFTGYPIGGAIVALLLVALVWQVFELFDGDNITVPETGWRAVETAGTPDVEEPGGPTLAQKILTERTELQRPRSASGPASGETPSPAPPDGGVRLTEYPWKAPRRRCPKAGAHRRTRRPKFCAPASGSKASRHCPMSAPRFSSGRTPATGASAWRM